MAENAERLREEIAYLSGKLVHFTLILLRFCLGILKDSQGVFNVDSGVRFHSEIFCFTLLHRVELSEFIQENRVRDIAVSVTFYYLHFCILGLMLCWFSSSLFSCYNLLRWI